MCVPVDQLRQAGIGLDGQKSGPVCGEPMQMSGHFARAGAAIQLDQRNVQSVHHGRGGSDIRTHQQCAGGFHSDLHEDRRVFTACPGEFRAIDRRFDLQACPAGSIRMASTPPRSGSGIVPPTQPVADRWRYCPGFVQLRSGPTTLPITQRWVRRQQAFRRFARKFSSFLVDPGRCARQGRIRPTSQA